MIIIIVSLLVLTLAVFYAVSSIRVVRQWDEMLVFTFGRYVGTMSPGFHFVWKGFQRAVVVDRRIITTGFRTEGTLSRDKVPVTLVAVLFWRVVDTKRAIIDVENYKSAIDLAAQTTLRDVVSRSDLEELMSSQHHLNEEILMRIRERAASWGIEVQNVEIRDLEIPLSLQDVLSRKAQAQAEKAARRIYGEAEVVAAEEFVKAADLYQTSQIAFRLRGLNVLLEAVKSDKNTLLFLPTELMDMLRSSDIHPDTLTDLTQSFHAKPAPNSEKPSP